MRILLTASRLPLKASRQNATRLPDGLAKRPKFSALRAHVCQKKRMGRMEEQMLRQLTTRTDERAHRPGRWAALLAGIPSSQQDFYLRDRRIARGFDVCADFQPYCSQMTMRTTGTFWT